MKHNAPAHQPRLLQHYIRIVRNDNSVDYQWLMQGDIERLKHYSEKANSKWNEQTRRRELGNANALYTSNNGGIDPGFLENKMIKHAFDAYPKVRTGKVYHYGNRPGGRRNHRLWNCGRCQYCTGRPKHSFWDEEKAAHRTGTGICKCQQSR